MLGADGPPVLARHTIDHRLALGGIRRCAKCGEPSVGQSTAAVERSRDVAAQPDIEGILGGLRRDGDVGERARRPLVADDLAGPQPAQDRQRVLHLLGAGRARDADGAALTADGEARHERQQEVAARQHIQRRHGLGQPDQIAPRQQHGRPDLEARTGAGDPGQPDQRVGSRSRQDLGKPQRVEARRGDPLRQRHHGLGADVLTARADTDTDLHGAPSNAAMARVTPASSTSRCVTKRTIPGAMACASTPCSSR